MFDEPLFTIGRNPVTAAPVAVVVVISVSTIVVSWLLQHTAAKLLTRFGSGEGSVGAVRRAKSQLHEAIWSAFKEAGIVIAFPQLDIHLAPEVECRLSRSE